jgi:hypothetical protein
MNMTLFGILSVLALMVVSLGLIECGRWLGARRRARHPEAGASGAGIVEGAIFALLGLLIAFTFSGAASRFDTRRNSLIAEANCIGTAWLRVDLLPAAAQPPVREAFRRYVDARIEVFRTLPDLDAAKAEVARANSLQSQIWTQAVTACRDSGSLPAALLLLPALNEMFDAAATRTAQAQIHQSVVVLGMLGLLALAGSLLAGFRLGTDRFRDWFLESAYVIVITLAIFVILDLEYPRMGFIRIDSLDQLLIDVRQSMKP